MDEKEAPPVEGPDEFSSYADHHIKPDCPGRFVHGIEEDAPYNASGLPVKLKYASLLVCHSCEAAYYTEGFEDFADNALAHGLLFKAEPLTEADKKFLGGHFKLVHHRRHELRDLLAKHEEVT